jgi:hypothetical protein
VLSVSNSLSLNRATCVTDELFDTLCDFVCFLCVTSYTVTKERKIYNNVLALRPSERYTAVMATKKTTTKRKSPAKRSRKSAEMKSFRIAKEETPFLTFKLTKQTLYWLVLAVVVIGFTLWILKLQSDIQDIYNSIDASSNAPVEMTVPTEKHK